MLKHIHIQLHKQLYTLTFFQFLTFLSISLLNLRMCCRLRLPAKIKIQTIKNCNICKRKSILFKRVEVKHEKKPLSNLKSIQNLVFEQITTKCEGFCYAKIMSLQEKTVVETISADINDSFYVLCFDLHIINKFVKSTKAKRWKDVMFKLALYCLFVNVDDLNL